jgi:redox-sensitive bicupin YhaK (pirin superfamily)
MLKKVPADDFKVADEGWHVCRFHFSYGDYINPDRIQFGVLRLFNDDIIQPGKGYDTHPHNELEIVSYCVRGELVHRDAMGNHTSLRRGDVQYVCSGSGTTHSLISGAQGEDLRLLQMWILPDKKGFTPQYQHKRTVKEDRRNKLLHVVSNEIENGTIQIHQDAHIYVSELDGGNQLTFDQKRARQSYLVCIEGGLDVNGVILHQFDAMEITGEQRLCIDALEDAHLLLVEMAEM